MGCHDKHRRSDPAVEERAMTLQGDWPDDSHGRIICRAAGNVGWRRVIDTYQDVAQAVGLDNSTAPYL